MAAVSGLVESRAARIASALATPRGAVGGCATAVAAAGARALPAPER
jgi:hypothetical protein